MRTSKRLTLDELAPFLWSPPSSSPAEPGAPPVCPPMDWQSLFQNDQPVEIEVGCGKGAFLVAVAPLRTDRNFFGIEIVRKYQLYTATRIAIRQLAHVRVACLDAKWFIRDVVPAGSVAAIHVYFPDPWWKKRHHKRRVFTPDFVASCATALQPGGRYYIASDVPEYFEHMTGLCRAEPRLGELPDVGPAHGVDVVTNFEKKGLTKGHPIGRACFERLIEPGVKTVP